MPTHNEIRTCDLVRSTTVHGFGPPTFRLNNTLLKAAYSITVHQLSRASSRLSRAFVRFLFHERNHFFSCHWKILQISLTSFPNQKSLVRYKSKKDERGRRSNCGFSISNVSFPSFFFPISYGFFTFRAQTLMKGRLKGAQKGHSLLKKKADALNMRFRTILGKIIQVRLQIFLPYLAICLS